MARVRGSRSRVLVPRPTSLSMSMLPPRFSMFVRTTSMPTPRPEMSLTFSAVEKPGAKTSRVASRSSKRAACSAVMTPFSTAFARIRWGSMPRPSSRISRFTWPPSWKARTSSRPARGLPATARVFGSSKPWSSELRIRWFSGSDRASTMDLSNSTSLPVTTSSISLPVCCAS